jgi:membrane-associated phospholipid phosphatase
MQTKTTARAQPGKRRGRHAIWWPGHGTGRFGWVWHPALVGACIGVAFFVHSVSVNSLDVWITTHLQKLTALHGLMVALSWGGYFPQQLILSIVFTVLVLLLWGWRYTAAFVVTITGASLLSTAIKAIVARPRPTSAFVDIASANSGFSFPSGHVLNYTALLGFLVWAALHREHIAWRRALIIVPSVAIIALIGPSRIYLGAHWTSDVIGAYLLAGAWLALSTTIMRHVTDAAVAAVENRTMQTEVQPREASRHADDTTYARRPIEQSRTDDSAPPERDGKIHVGRSRSPGDRRRRIGSRST